MALAIGRLDDALVNPPWLAGFVALGLGVFGQLRRLGVGTSWATIAAWLVLSLPLLDTHVALAGYADFHMAAAYALAVLALAQWELAFAGRAGALRRGPALLPLLKVPGSRGWGRSRSGSRSPGSGPRRHGSSASAPRCSPSRSPAECSSARRRSRPSGADAVPYRRVAGAAPVRLRQLPPALVPAAAGARRWLARTRRAEGDDDRAAAGFGFLLWTFLFTQAGDWVVDYTTVNRALLHIAPALTAFGALFAWRWAVARAPTRVAVPLRRALRPAAGGDVGLNGVSRRGPRCARVR